MNILIGTILIGGGAVWLWFLLGGDVARSKAYAGTLDTLLFTAPRILMALLGAAYFAEILPEEDMRRLFGAEAGLMGVLLAVALGPVSPGGAFVAFAIAAAALKAGAGEAAALGYVTSWSLYSLAKLLAYELPIMGRDVTLVRVAVCLPVPFIVAGLAVLF